MNITPLYNWAMSIKATSINSAISEFGIEAQRIVDEYISGGASYASALAEFLRTADNAFINAAEQAWADGGRDLSDLPQNTLTEVLSLQRGFARAAWLKLQAQVKTARDAGQDTSGLGAGFGDRWAAGLWGEYNYFKMLSKSGTGKLFFWVLGNTEKHCATCKSLAAGAGHTIDWYIARDYIPGRNGAAMECGGYWCDCTLVDAAGHDWTLTPTAG